MRVLIAEDDPVSRRVLEVTLVRWGYEVTPTGNGAEAWQVLQGPDAPSLAILDWMMPEMDGVDVCRKVRERPASAPTYLILLTTRSDKEDIVAGLQAGADDYVTKPFDRDELHARLAVGVRVIELETNLAARVKELEEALSQVKQLRGLLPICSYCKKIRDDQNYWRQVESYVSEYSEVRFSHSICPSCFEQYVKPQLDEL